MSDSETYVVSGQGHVLGENCTATVWVRPTIPRESRIPVQHRLSALVREQPGATVQHFEHTRRESTFRLHNLHPNCKELAPDNINAHEALLRQEGVRLVLLALGETGLAGSAKR